MAGEPEGSTYDLRSFDAAGNDLTARAAFLELSRETLSAQIEPLELASERGCVEYKQKIAGAAFRRLSEARYKSLSAEQLDLVGTELALLSFASALQRMMSLGSVHIREAKRPDSAGGTEAAAEIPIKAIIADVQQRVNADPSARQQQEVKNILMHLSRYQREAGKLKEAASGAQPGVKKAMTENFSQLAEEIFTSIRKNYQAIENREKQSLRTEPGNILLRVALKEIAPVYRAQTKLSLGIRSRLQRARHQGHGAREVFVEASGQEGAYQTLLEREFEAFRNLGGTDTVAHRIAQAFAEEIRRKIALETEVY